MILSVNIDHIASIRNLRNLSHSNLLRALEIMKYAGVKIVTIHLREDRRHINDEDVSLICNSRILPVNLEIAATDEMVEIAIKNKPDFICFVPEKRMELTTEGGLDVLTMEQKLQNFTSELKKRSIKVSFFVDPIKEMLDATLRCGADSAELHTGKYANSLSTEDLNEIKRAAEHGKQIGLDIHAGHGLTFESAYFISQIKEISTIHVGHFLITESIFCGLFASTSRMKNIIEN